MSNNKDIRSMYENNWKKMTGLQMSQVVAEFGYDQVSHLPKGKALDIGCGDGTNAVTLQGLGYSVSACDIAEQAIVKAKKKGIIAKRVDVNHTPLPYKSNSFDLIWLSDVIEHVVWPDSLISELFRLLKPSGYLFLSTPNVSWWGIRLQFALGKTLKEMHPEHIWWFNLRQLNLLLKSHGFKKIKVYGYNCLVPHPLVNRISSLGLFNRMGDVNTLMTYTFAAIVQK